MSFDVYFCKYKALNHQFCSDLKFIMIPSEIHPVENLFAIAPILSNIADKDTFPHLVSASPAYAKFAEAMKQAKLYNPWFTDQNIGQAISGLAHMLREEALEEWLEQYPFLEKTRESKRIGLVLAGNIPMVGFHDLFCVMVAGHTAVVKASGQDKILLPALIDLLKSEIEGFAWEVEWMEGKLGPVDAVIATGSNNTARYFEYYFGKYPHIIRKNRSSVAILTGAESQEELVALGEDIFSYYGLGCRNVSKLYVHQNFNLDHFFEAIYAHNEIVNHHKYANNYDYYRALWLMNQEKILDNGFMILRESEAISSPVGTTFYERFDDESALRKNLETHKDEIQCTVSKSDIPFGNSQKPELWDYADGVDTMAFLGET